MVAVVLAVYRLLDRALDISKLQCALASCLSYTLFTGPLKPLAPVNRVDLAYVRGPSTLKETVKFEREDE